MLLGCGGGGGGFMMRQHTSECYLVVVVLDMLCMLCYVCSLNFTGNFIQIYVA
jgi:hypothetical protein